MTVELVTFGETMVRLSPPDHQRLEQAHTLDLHVGGSEFNTAVAAARLGVPTAYITRLTRNPLGRMIENKAREHGIDTSGIAWTDDARVGTYYAEFGASPRANSVIYDRADSAMAQIEPDDVNWPAVLEGVRVFHTSGITPALSKNSAETTLLAVRSTTEEDTERVYGITAESYETVVRTRRCGNTWTDTAHERESDSIHRAPKFDTEVVDRVGSGDAFAGGFLYGMLRDDPAAGVRYGVGMSAIKQTYPGDLCWGTLDEVERVLAGEGLRIVRW